MITVSNSYKTSIYIEGQEVKVAITKFNDQDELWFSPRWETQRRDNFAAAHELQQFAERYRTAEAAKRGVPITEIPLLRGDMAIAMLEAELSPEDREARRARELALAKEGTAFAIEAVTRFVTIEPGQIYDADLRRELTSGEDLVRHFIAREEVLTLLMSQIYLQNHLSEEQKKTLPSLFASVPSSPQSSTVAGPTPDATAESAASPASATPAAASGRRGRTLSGPTTPLRPSSVPS